MSRSDEPLILESAYAAFNARDIDTVLSLLHPDVVWPNGLEGGYVYGRAAVRAYWTRQWMQIHPHVEPLRMAHDADGRIITEVRQVVRDMTGVVIAGQIVEHVYGFNDGLIARMEIRRPDAASTFSR
jgi:ketosteroid isomerase-like protein